MSSKKPHADFTDVTIIVVAGGSGTRTGPGMPKQYRLLGGRPMIAITMSALAEAAPGARLLPVIDRAALALYHASIADLPVHIRAAIGDPVQGGATRQESARLGLESLATQNEKPKIVLIHDSARPFAPNKLIVDAIACAKSHAAAVPVLKIIDTIKQVDATGRVIATPDRADLRAVQTPQAFSFGLILDAHRKAWAAGFRNLTDDAAVAEWAGHTVQTFDGDAGNLKVTTMADFNNAEARLFGNLGDIRTGQGFDVHAFCAGDHVWLGGVKIPHAQALSGHSDADVLMHAITDALLGAIADGDIGVHFPPSDPQWAGEASEIFLRHAAKLVRAKGGVIAHIDATVICEAPKVGPYRDAIRARLCETLMLPADRVAVKATTTERLGFTGRGEGIAAMATASVRLPFAADC